MTWNSRSASKHALSDSGRATLVMGACSMQQPCLHACFMPAAQCLLSTRLEASLSRRLALETWTGLVQHGEADSRGFDALSVCGCQLHGKRRTGSGMVVDCGPWRDERGCGESFVLT